MAFRRANRLFNITKISSQNLTLKHPHVFSPSLQAPIASDPANTTFYRDFLSPPDSGENGFFRRFLQRRAIVQSTTSPASPEIRSLPIGDKLIEKLKGLNINRERIRLDGLNPPALRFDLLQGLSVEDARKLLKLSQLEKMKSTLRRIQKNCISYSEFVQICVETEGSSNIDEGLKLAKSVDESGIVIVLGNVVYLWPEEIAKAIEGVLPLTMPNPNDPRRKELEIMEKAKMAIDEKAEAFVRRELWCGLGFLIAQTVGFMRLTFWELSWDVMEPICFYVTSIYFMAGYTFFLRTSKDPSFEGFFESRFSTKQKRLMKMKKFDINRYNELRRACYPASFSSSELVSSSSSFYKSERTLMGSLPH